MGGGGRREKECVRESARHRESVNPIHSHRVLCVSSLLELDSN